MRRQGPQDDDYRDPTEGVRNDHDLLHPRKLRCTQGIYYSLNQGNSDHEKCSLPSEGNVSRAVGDNDGLDDVSYNITHSCCPCLPR
jgi:hypothetical protein